MITYEFSTANATRHKNGSTDLLIFDVIPVVNDEDVMKVLGA
jgi:hypothetical protein